jgi:hypothetical protein
MKSIVFASFLALLSAVGCLQDTVAGNVVGGADDAADDVNPDNRADTLPKPACMADADCDDGDPCTVDMCGETNVCIHTPKTNNNCT